jgi:RNA polymerase sigma factor (sigma-70 family)
MSPEARRTEALLEHAAWIRELARALVRDPDRAEDVAQQTLVAAWKHAPLDERGLRGWLTQVVRNFARVEARSRKRRERHESGAARPEAQPSTHEVVERVHVQRELVAAVLELDEPYRTVLLLRFYEGKPPRAIARELDRPIASVRSQLARGLALLRARLDAAHGDRSSWALMLLPLARPENLLTVPLAGALVMNAKIQIAAALAVVGAAALLLTLSRGGPEQPSPEITRAVGESQGSALETALPPRIETGTSSEPARAAVESGRPAPAPATAVPAAELVHGRVLGGDAQALAGVRVELGPGASAGVPLAASAGGPALGATSGADGLFELDPQGRSGRVRAADPRYETVLAGVLERGTRELQVVVAPRAAAGGRVQDSQGHPLAGAKIRVWTSPAVRTRFARALDQAEDVERRVASDERGEFRFESLPLFDGMRIECELSGFEAWGARLVDVLADDMTITLARVGAQERAVRGRVVDLQGQPVAGALVALGLDTTSSDEHGLFVLKLDDPHSAMRGWPQKPALLRAAKAGCLPAELAAELVLGQPHWPDFVVLKLGGVPLSIGGRVLGADGKPSAGALVWVSNTTTLGYGEEYLLQVESLLGGSEQTWAKVESDGEGRFEIRGLLEHPYTVVALDPRSLRRAIAREVAPGTSALELAFRADDVYARLAGRVVDARGKPVAGVRVRLLANVFEAHSGARRILSHTFPLEGPATDAEGRFELRDVPLEGVGLSFESDAIIPRSIGNADFREDGTSSTTLADFVGTHPEALEVVVEQRAHVQLELVDSSGQPEFKLLDEQGQAVEMNVFMGTTRVFLQRVQCLEGRSHVVSTTERAHWLVLSRDGKETQRVRIQLVPGETTHVKL